MGTCYIKTKKKIPPQMIPLPLSFYEGDVVNIAEKLLGKLLLTKIGKEPVTGGIIIETEAYKGPEDKACHAYNMRRTKRTEVMFHQGGISYVYLCYGMHTLLNIVTGGENMPHAVLIRAIKPTVGIETIKKRRKGKPLLADGPGKVCQALGICIEHNGLSLLGKTIWIEDTSLYFHKNQITKGPRVGVDYAEEHALLPWRFQLKLKSAINSS